MHYTSPNNLSSHLSIFSPLLPSVSTSLSSASLKAVHLSAISMPGHTTPPFNTILISPSIFLHLILFFFFHLLSLPGYLSHIPAPYALHTFSCPRLFRVKLNPVNVSWFNSADLKKTDLEKGDKLYQICSSSPLCGQCVYFYIPLRPAPPILSTLSSPRTFSPASSLSVSSGRHCHSLDSEESLQWLTLIKVVNESPFRSADLKVHVCSTLGLSCEASCVCVQHVSIKLSLISAGRWRRKVQLRELEV